MGLFSDPRVDEDNDNEDYDHAKQVCALHNLLGLTF